MPRTPTSKPRRAARSKDRQRPGTAATRKREAVSDQPSTVALGYSEVQIAKKLEGWSFAARYLNGQAEVGEVDCDADASPDEAVSAWLEEHIGYGGKGPDRIETVSSLALEGQRLIWLDETLVEIAHKADELGERAQRLVIEFPGGGDFRPFVAELAEILSRLATTLRGPR